MENWTIDKWKSLVEILAILAAGAFAFLTWGLDELRFREPNWSIYIDSTSIFETITDIDGRKVCDYKATVHVTNNSKTPLYIRDTIIDYFIVPRPDTTKNGVTESSLFQLTKKICSSTEKCTDSVHTTTIGSVDKFPIPPSQTAWRPFHIQFDASAIGKNNGSLESELKDYVLLIRIQQQIGDYELPVEKLEVSVSTYYDPNICGVLNPKSNNTSNSRE